MGEDSSRLITVSSTEHHDALVSGLWGFFSSGHRVDLKFHGTEWSVVAHQLIVDVFLSAEKFSPDVIDERFLRKTGHLECGGGRSVLEDLLEFLYTGSVVVREDQLEDLEEAAKHLDFKMLMEALSGLPKSGTAEKVKIRTRNSRKCQIPLRRNLGPCKVTNDSELPEASSKRIYPRRAKEVKDSDDDKDDPNFEDSNENLVSGIVRPEDDMRTEPKLTRSKRRALPRPPKFDSKMTSIGGKDQSNASLKRVVTPVELSCGECDFKTCRKIALRAHKKAQHCQSEVTVPGCHLCGREFLKMPQYRSHMFATHQIGRKRKTKDKMKCPECEYTCSSRCIFKTHVATHAGIKSFKCLQCDFASCHTGSLIRHVKFKHLNVKKFLCDMCGFGAVTASNLERHKWRHTQEKPFKCSECPKAFRCPSAKKEHMRRHVAPDEKSFVCHLCSNAFFRRPHLYRHLRNIHHIHQSEVHVGSSDPAPPGSPVQ